VFSVFGRYCGQPNSQFFTHNLQEDGRIFTKRHSFADEPVDSPINDILLHRRYFAVPSGKAVEETNQHSLSESQGRPKVTVWTNAKLLYNESQELNIFNTRFPMSNATENSPK
jgi:hypothetical protein